jgi:hypothetical protein
MSAEHHLARARELYERSVLSDDGEALAAADRELDAVEAELALTRGAREHDAIEADLALAPDTRELNTVEAEPALAPGTREHDAIEADLALAPGKREHDAVEAELALARGKVVHARLLQDRVEDPSELPLFSRAALLYQRLGDARGEGEALFWIGCFHQVIRQDDDAALPALQRARALATAAGDAATLAGVLHQLGNCAHLAGRLGEAREHLLAAARLREDAGDPAGVAASLVDLAYVAAAGGRAGEAAGGRAVGGGQAGEAGEAGEVAALLERAERLAAEHGAVGVARRVGEARRQLDYDRAS